MPTMRNQETGETREISPEELAKAMREGRASVRQEVQHADGSVTSSMVFGSDPRDGVDRSLNIFGAMDALVEPVIRAARKIKEADENAEKLFFMDNAGADYEAVVDDMAMPIMYIVTCTKESVHVARYMRDERRSTRKPMSEDTFAFTDGKLSATLEEVQGGKKLLMFALSVYEIRKLLEERGLLQELKKLNNRASGVLVTTEGEETVTKLVRGHDRPELPCLLFGGLFAKGVEDAVMMRPYPDEAMTDAARGAMTEEELIREAENGDPDCMEHLATAYLNGNGVERDFTRSAHWWKKLAETGRSVAYFNLGLYCAKGCGVKRDYAEAARWMRLAADAGDQDAADLAEQYSAMHSLHARAERGDAKAQGELAGKLMALAGSLEQFGPGEDYARAFALAERSASQGDPQGTWALGLAYEHGRGTPPNPQKALACYERAAGLGFIRAKNTLACKIILGSAPGHTKEEAFGMLLEAAEAGDAEAMRNLGMAYQFGHGVQANMEKAVYWYERSLELMPDEELAKKVAVFKTLPGTDGQPSDPAWLDPWEEMRNLALFTRSDEITQAGGPGNPGEMPEMSIRRIPGGYRFTDLMISNTGYEGRAARIETLRKGDAVKTALINTGVDRIEVFNARGESLGLISSDSYIARAMKDASGEVRSAHVSYVLPKSKKGPRAKKADLCVTLDFIRKGSKEQADIGSGCVIYDLEGDQTDIWAQKLTICRCDMPMARAKALFELYNRWHDEYSAAEKGEAADTSYAGLSNLAGEIRAARARMLSQAMDGQDLSKLEMGQVPADDPRYAGIEPGTVSEEYSHGLADEFRIWSRSIETYYWLDQTRVTKEEYDAEAQVLSHPYRVLELMDPADLPFDPVDENMVSIFGSGRFIAFADLSYGC